jgi:hypothetical protein
MRYSTNVDKLLSYGEFNYGTWPNYLELGFTLDDVPALLQLVKDEESFWDEEKPAASAPYHAWRVLGQLKAEEAIFPLLAAIDEESDWCSEEIPKILGRIGEKAIEPTRSYLTDSSKSEDLRSVLPNVFTEIVKNYPEYREQCVAILTELLPQIHQKDSTLAGLTIAELMDMNAVESIGTIREAFQRGCVDISIVGDIEDFEIEFGLRKQRSTPRPIPPQIKKLRELLKQNFNVDFDEEPVSKTEQVIKVGRNDPCPCGSGKKYKKCCLQ